MKVRHFGILNIIITLIFLLSIYLASKYYNSHVNLGTTKFYKYDLMKEKSISIANLGSSHGFYGIKYENDIGINLAKDSQDTYYDLQLLKKYSLKLRDNSIIIIPISIFTFYSVDNSEINKNYIQILKLEDIKNIKLNEYIMGKYFSVVYPPQRILETIKFIKNNGIKKKIYYTQREDLDRDKLEEESKETVIRHMKKEKDKEGRVIKKAEKELYSLVDYIEKNNWTPIFITTPFSYLYNQGIESIDPNAYKERIYDNIEMIRKKYNKNFIYLDYSHDKRFENKLEYFFDDDHLNKKGAEYFTEILLKDIEKVK